jgi:hypothetical protein
MSVEDCSFNNSSSMTSPAVSKGKAGHILLVCPRGAAPAATLAVHISPALN